MPVLNMVKKVRLQKPNRYEPTVRACCKAVGLPMPDPEWVFAMPRRWRFDFAWPDKKVALEVDGGMWVQGRHSRGSGLLLEHEKMNAAASRNWLIFRTTPKGVGDLALYRQIKAVL